MNSERNIGNYGPPGDDRMKFVTKDRNAAPAAVETEKPANKRSERQEFERVLAAIMGVVRQFPEVLKQVVMAMQEEKALCPI